MLKGWKYSQSRPNIKVCCGDGEGCVYAVKIKTDTGSVLKIGATRNPNARLLQFASRTAAIFCVSQPHLNFWENEAILHEHFEKYRVQAKPGSHVQPELFDISLTHFFRNLPELNYITDIREIQTIEYYHGEPIYYEKEKGLGAP